MYAPSALITRFLTTTVGLLFVCCSALSQSTNPLEIVPSTDFYYLKNWPVHGEIKSIRILRYQPRNSADRFITFEACRLDAHDEEKYHSQEETYTFNKKGQLIKRAVKAYKVNSSTLYEYNFFEKISVIESVDKQIKFTYDLDGRLTAKEFYEGAKNTMVTGIQYFGDTILSVTKTIDGASLDTLKEVLDKNGRLIYRGQKLSGYNWKEDFYEYDELGRLKRNWNSLDYYFEYEYDDKGRILKTFIRPDKSFMSLCSYDDLNGICRTSRCEHIAGAYVERNYDCVCTATDGQNNPIRREFIDCTKSGDEPTFKMNGFIQVEYEFFRK